MLSKLLRPLRRAAPRPSASLPPGERVYAVGDIHGCADLLDRLIAATDADDVARGPARTTLIFLGDLVDRGPESARVIETLRTLAIARPATRFILGNHEEIFLGALDGDAKALRMFCRIGGRETIMSYGLDAAGYERLDYDELAAELAARVPPAHATFLRGFDDSVTIGDYMFVHAGVRPDRPLDDQRTADLRWIRGPFLDHATPLDRMIVHGHTVSDTVERRGHRIGVDTGAYASGMLTALGIEGAETWTIVATSADISQPR